MPILSLAYSTKVIEIIMNFGNFHSFGGTIRKNKERGLTNVIQIEESIEIDFHQMVDNSLNTYLIIDRDKTILYCNKPGLELLNLSKKDILYKSVCCFIPDEQHCICEELIEEVFEKKEMIKPRDIKIIKNGGQIIEVEMMSFPYLIKGNVFAQIIIRDISYRKIAEKLVSDSEKLASLGQLAAGIIHEIKNPLTAVKGFLQLLKESHSNAYLDVMESELNKALETLQNLLQVSKPDLQEEPFHPIDLSEELASILPLFQDKIYSLEVETDIRDQGIFIMGKKNSFLKAFFNLIKNAIEAMDGNGKLKIEYYYNNGWIHFKLSDTGVGIAYEKLKMLGTPFFSTKTNGTGLGLNQVYTTIHDHGGIILVNSLVGEGTTFHIQLPVKPSLSII
jgi:two-component system sporulation sensor kinase A